MYIDDKTVDDGQESVVDSQKNKDIEDVVDADVDTLDDIDDGDSEVDSDTSGTLEVAEPEQKKQSLEENAQYKKMRLRAEDEARKQLEKERNEITQERLMLQQQLAERNVYSNHVTPEKIQDMAYEKGVSEDVARQLLQYEAKSLIEAEKHKVKEKFDLVQSQKRELADDEYFHLLEKEVDTIVSANPDAEYEAVYAWLKHKKEKELRQQLGSRVEKRTIANMHDRARRKSISGSDGGADDSVMPTSSLSKEGMEMANVFGTDPRKIAKYVKTNTQKKGR